MMRPMEIMIEQIFAAPNLPFHIFIAEAELWENYEVPWPAVQLGLNHHDPLQIMDINKHVG